MGRKRVQGKVSRPCAHPECSKTLREGSWNFPTGFCVAHQPQEPVVMKPGREGVRAHIVQLVPGCSTLAAERMVSLSREPWL